MLLTVKDTAKRIKQGKILFLAGEEALLRQLPKGHWIGGTIPYFMTEQGGLSSTDKIFVNEVPPLVSSSKIISYEEPQLRRIPADAFDNGFSLVIIPYASGAHFSYAKNAQAYPNLFLKPIIGWIAGVHLENPGQMTPKVFNGETGEGFEQQAVVMHLSLPLAKMAMIQTINPFKPGKGDHITFENEGFEIAECLVNGQPQNFARYLLQNKIDLKFPLVANYSGTPVNVSFQNIDSTAKIVKLYAPVFKNITYQLAVPLQDYVAKFKEELSFQHLDSPPVFACNCILNYVHSELKGKRTGFFVGPMTFGEIAYQLVNQTLVYLEIEDS